MNFNEKNGIEKSTKGPEINLLDLYNEIKNGNKEGRAETELYVYIQRIYGPTVRIKIGDDNSEDFLHDVFLIIMKNFSQGEIKNESTQAISSYIYNLIKNNIANYKKKDSLRLRTFVPIRDENAGVEKTFNGRSETMNLYKKQLLAEIRKQLPKMEEEERQILDSYYFKGMTKEEIQREMNITETRFRNKKHRALKRIKEKLKKYNTKLT